jgi:hypothetical protein
MVLSPAAALWLPSLTCLPACCLDLPPAGFFEDKKADAKARGEVPKSQKDMTKVRVVHSGCWAAAGVARASVIATTSRCDNKAVPARLRACPPASSATQGPVCVISPTRFSCLCACLPASVCRSMPIS